MPIIAIILIIIVLGFILFFAGLYHGIEGQGLIGWLRVAFFIAPLFAGALAWNILAYCNRVEDTNVETFHAVSVTKHNGIDVQYITVEHNGRMFFFNLNEEFNGIIQKDDYIRRFSLENWKYGINFLRCLGDYEYELITPKHKRYAEAKEKIGDQNE